MSHQTGLNIILNLNIYYYREGYRQGDSMPDFSAIVGVIYGPKHVQKWISCTKRANKLYLLQQNYTTYYKPIHTTIYTPIDTTFLTYGGYYHFTDVSP